MKTLHAITVLSLAVLLSACASSGSASRSEPSASASRPDPNLITGAEIAGTSASSLYDVVRALRPTWMRRSRPMVLTQQQNEPELIVYVDGARFGNMESLRQLVPSTVQSVRYYSSSAAGAKFGTGHLQGAIEVTTKGQ